MSVSVRPVKKNDRDAILALSKITLEEHRARFPDRFKGEDAVERYLDDLFGGKIRGIALVAEHAGQVIGWTAFSQIEIPATGNDHDVLGLIVDLTVAESKRNRGVGSALIGELVERAKATGITLLFGEVWMGASSSGVLSRAGILPVRTVHERRLAEARKGPPKAGRPKRIADRILPLLTIILVGILMFELFGR